MRRVFMFDPVGGVGYAVAAARLQHDVAISAGADGDRIRRVDCARFKQFYGDTVDGHAETWHWNSSLPALSLGRLAWVSSSARFQVVS